MGLRGYRKDVKGLPGRPDIAYMRDKVAVFVHGCFWHRCPTCALKIPKNNPEYWKWKFTRNQQRDARVVAELEEAGWKVVRLWSCDVMRAPREAAEAVRLAVAFARLNAS